MDTYQSSWAKVLNKSQSSRRAFIDLEIRCFFRLFEFICQVVLLLINQFFPLKTYTNHQ